MMRRNYGSFRNSGAYTSPGTPEHCDDKPGEIIPKTWSSERVPLPAAGGARRPVPAAALMPFNSGRTLPSKWDDAERWITSPLSGYGAFKIQPQRRPKSKSGPLGATGVVYVPNCSPTVAGNFMANSPLTTGVLVPEGLSVHYEAGMRARSKFSFDESNMNRSLSIPSDLISESSMPNSPLNCTTGDEMEGAREDDEGPVLCRDVATQMSPDQASACSSSMGRLSFSNLPRGNPPASSSPAQKDEVRDVQVDRGTTTPVRHSKKRAIKSSSNAEHHSPSPWNVTEASKSMSKVQREELKITAWENLQKAKAEAAIRKLEMKLEKRRSASMDKITNKLRGAQIKAQRMRESLSEQPPRHSYNKFFCCIYIKKPSLFRCFS